MFPINVESSVFRMAEFLLAPKSRCWASLNSNVWFVPHYAHVFSKLPSRMMYRPQADINSYFLSRNCRTCMVVDRWLQLSQCVRVQFFYPIRMWHEVKTQLAFIAASSLLSVWCVTASRGFTSHTGLLVACSFYISEISVIKHLTLLFYFHLVSIRGFCC